MGRTVRGNRTFLIPLSIRHISRFALVCLVCAFAVPTTPTATQAQTTNVPVTVETTLISPANGQAAIGDTITYQIKLTNTGTTLIDVLPLGDTFDPTYLRFASASIAGVAITPDMQKANVVNWNDLTTLPQVGNLPVGGKVEVQVQFTALADTKSGGSLDPSTGAGAPGTALPGTTVQQVTPHDFYDKETRFLIDYAIDPTNGGIFLGLRGDGSLWAKIPDRIYGFAGDTFNGSDKHTGGQAVCIEYFIREYQRLSDTGRTITTKTHGVQTARDMLSWAKNCADFLNNHMIIGNGQNEPANSPICPNKLVDGNKCIYYWGFVDATGTQTHMPPTGPLPGDNSTTITVPPTFHIADSFAAWTQAELAQILYAAGDSSYATYRDAAKGFFDWASRVGPPLDSTMGSYSSRDNLWAGLAMSLYEVSVAEGKANEALRTEAIDCVNGTGLYTQSGNWRGRCNGGSYTTAYGRAAANAMELQHRGIDNYTISQKANWRRFGDRHYGMNPATPQNPYTPFAHGAGREFVAGNQRSHWFYYTFSDGAINGVAGQVPPAGYTIESWSRAAIFGYWEYANTYMWDTTAGKEAWWDARLTPGKEGYKPCFSLGTPVPIADWKAPLIGDKVHTLNSDGSATVTVSGVSDPDWQYTTWKFKGIGMKAVRVFYSTDDGASWTGLQTTSTTTGTYIATIPPQPGKTVLYYAEAEDAFGNISTFPANAPQVYQLYTFQDLTYNMAWSSGSSSKITLNITPKPNAVTLSRLEATRQGDSVQVNWRTSSEQHAYGFNVYRGTRLDRSDAVLVNGSLIASRGAGTEYSVLDSAPLHDSGVYWLEEVDLDGQSSWYRVSVSATPNALYRTFLPSIKRSR